MRFLVMLLVCGAVFGILEGPLGSFGAVVAAVLLFVTWGRMNTRASVEGLVESNLWVFFQLVSRGVHPDKAMTRVVQTRFPSSPATQSRLAASMAVRRSLGSDDQLRALVYDIFCEENGVPPQDVRDRIEASIDRTLALQCGMRQGRSRTMWGVPKWVRTIVPVRDKLAYSRRRFNEIAQQLAREANPEWRHVAPGCQCETALQAWQLVILRTCVEHRQYVPAKQYDDYSLTMWLAVAGEHSACGPLVETYGQHASSEGARGALLQDLCVSKGIPASCLVDVRIVLSLLELWINREVCLCFGDRASAERIRVTSVADGRQTTSQRPLSVF